MGQKKKAHDLPCTSWRWEICDSVYCALLLTIWCQHTLVKSRGEQCQRSLVSILCSSSTQIFNIWDWIASSFLSVDVLSSITWMQHYTKTLCWLPIYSEIPAPTTQKTSIALVLCSAVQRIDASSLRRGQFFSYFCSSSVISDITSQKKWTVLWMRTIITNWKKADINLKKLCMSFCTDIFPRQLHHSTGTWKNKQYNPHFSGQRACIIPAMTKPQYTRTSRRILQCHSSYTSPLIIVWSRESMDWSSLKFG